MIEVVMDFETYSACELKKAGAWRYAEDPTTAIICLWFNVDRDEPKAADFLRPGGELLALVNNPDAMFIAHNVEFEKAIWRRIMMTYGWPDIPNNRWSCTLSVCAMKVVPQSLDRASAFLGLDEDKDAEGSRITRGLSKTKKGYYDHGAPLIARTNEYCAQDIRTETKLLERVGYLPPGERNVWLLNQRVNERGVRLDRAYVRAAKTVVEKALVPLVAEFSELTGGLELMQVARIGKWLDTQGCGRDVPDLKAETLKRVLGGSIDETEEDEEDDPGAYHPKLPDHVRRVLTIRQLAGSASVKKLDRMEQCVCADGRARGLLQYHGTGPGRSAGRLLQPQNFPRGTLKLGDKAPKPEIVVDAIMTGDPDYVSMLLGPPIETVVSGLRHAIIADPGRVLLSGDYAGIQARVVLALAGQHDKTKLMSDPNVDIYCDMAQEIYKNPDITKANKNKYPAERQTGKNSVLGLGFQMGWRKFKLKYAENETDQFCQDVVHTYRKEWAPRVPYCWYGLQDAATEAVWTGEPRQAYGVEYRLEDGWLSARLPSGRKIWYYAPTKVRRAMPWDAKDIRPGFTYQAQKMGQVKVIQAFGGQLTENVVMGIERDLMTHAMFKLEKNGFPIVLDVHDEIVGEPLRTDADEKAFTEIMLDVEPWVHAMKIPVAVETWLGDRYKK
jgi:DNA polymerase